MTWSPTRPPVGEPWVKIFPWILASIPYAFLVVWFWERGPGLEADDYGLTLMHADALVEGRPYWETGYLPMRLDPAPAVQPPGLPLVVAGAMVLGGDSSMDAIRWAMALTGFPFFLLAGLVFARSHGTFTGLAVMVMLVVAIAGNGGFGATKVASDFGFASLVWGVIYLLDRGTTFRWPRVAAVFVLACAAMSYRYLGAALIPTIALFALSNPERGARKLLVPVGIWAAGGVAAVAVAGWSFLASQVWLHPRAFLFKVRGSWQTYLPSTIEAHLYPFPWDGANDVFHVFSLALALVGLALWTRTSWRSAPWLFTACYLLLLFWVWNQAGRYLVPVYPVLIFGLLHGAEGALGALRRAWSATRRRSGVAASGVLVAASALVILCVQQPRTGGYLHELPEAAALFSHLAAQPPGTVRVAFTEPRVLSWRTGVPATVIPGDQEMLPEFERLGITHVVLNRIGLEPGRVTRVRTIMANEPCRFEPTFDNGAFAVYRLLPPCEGGPSS